MSLAERALRRWEQVISPESVDWDRFLKPSDVARIIPFEALAEETKRRALLTTDADIEGLTLPWPKANGKVLIKPGKLCIWAGWSHHGKSQVCKQLMLHAVKEGERILVASMEEELGELCDALRDIACGTREPTAKEVDRFIAFLTGKMWFYDQQGVVEPRRLVALIRYASEKYKITQAVIDSLMMLAVDRDDYDAQSRFVGELKAAAKDTGVTIHLVAHMRKREGKTGDEAMGNMHDVAGGHEIASKADYVFNVWRNKAGIPGKPATILGVEKQRGRVNWIGKIGLEFDAQSGQFIEGTFPMKFWDDWRPIE